VSNKHPTLGLYLGSLHPPESVGANGSKIGRRTAKLRVARDGRPDGPLKMPDFAAGGGARTELRAKNLNFKFKL